MRVTVDLDDTTDLTALRNAVRVFGQALDPHVTRVTVHPGGPSHETLQPMAGAYIRAWLGKDWWTIARIAAAIDDTGATPRQVTEVVTLAAASMLTEAHGGWSAAAADHATGWQNRAVAAQIRLITR
jgi:hypothetical protein